MQTILSLELAYSRQQQYVQCEGTLYSGFRYSHCHQALFQPIFCKDEHPIICQAGAIYYRRGLLGFSVLAIFLPENRHSGNSVE